MNTATLEIRVSAKTKTSASTNQIISNQESVYITGKVPNINGCAASVFIMGNVCTCFLKRMSC